MRKGSMRRRLLAGWEHLERRELLATYYVAPGGNNSNLGTDQAPWATLQHAADRVQAGDTVIVRPGQYSGFDLRSDGTSAAPIRFLADDGAVINSRNSRTPDGINLEGADWIVIEGFEVTGVDRAGIRSVLNHHVVIRGNHAHHNGRWGIFTGFSDDLLIENNITTHSTLEHGIYVSNSGDRPVIRNNVTAFNRSNGIHMNGDISQGGDGVISSAVVEGNTIYENGAGGGSGINCDGVQNSLIQNNLLYDNHASGISLYRIDGGGASTGNRVINNTVIVASDGRWALNIRDGATGAAVLNNIFYNHHSYRGSISVSADSLSGLVSDYNVVMDRFTTSDGASVQTLAQWRTNTGQDQHSLISSPAALFVSAATDDYHLSASSPAIDRGTSQFAPASDLEGRPRPQGAGYDIGALERVPSRLENTVGIEADPNGAGGSALVVRGTSASDTIAFALARGGTHVSVKLNGVARGSYPLADFTRIVAYGRAGNDAISLTTGLTIAAQLDGEEGNDTLTGGHGHDILLGGDGDDTLVGRRGRNIFVGGEGADSLKSGAATSADSDGSDLLIGGRLTHAANDQALFSIVQEWLSTRSYADRTSRLASGADGLPRLDASSVLDDGDVDRLEGSVGLDWYFANASQDLIVGRRSNERLN